MENENKIMEVVNEEVILEEVTKSGMPVMAKVVLGALGVAVVATLGVFGYKRFKKSKELVDVTPEEVNNDEK